HRPSKNTRSRRSSADITVAWPLSFKRFGRNTCASAYVGVIPMGDDDTRALGAFRPDLVGYRERSSNFAAAGALGAACGRAALLALADRVLELPAAVAVA